MLIYRREAFCSFRDELTPLLEKHWEEVAIDKDTTPLDPDWSGYDLLERAGMLVCVTARAEDGRLVGYTSYTLTRHMHYNLQVADCGPFFLDPAFRKGLAGVNLFRAAEVVLKDLGVERVVHKVKLSHDVGRIFERMGYRPIERTYVKTLGGE